MSISVYSSTLVGVEAKLIEVEVDQRPGITKYHIVGLPDKACSEAKERIKSALRNNKIKLPQCQVVFNLAPADLPKSGSVFDLAMALGLAARGKVFPEQALEQQLFLGELALDGTVRPVRGALAAAQLAKQQQFTSLFVPDANKKEAALIKGINIYPVKTLGQVISHLQKQILLEPYVLRETSVSPVKHKQDFKDIKGHVIAKRALEIAAAGGHNVLLEGPPGSGKTLLAKTLISVLPELSEEEAIEVIKIHSAAGLSTSTVSFGKRPWRAPHHSASARSLVGGGQNPRPGEISLAHRGILFLDELPEFPRAVLETLRQPLENHAITIARVQQTIEFPANFLLIAAMNPCPCGFATDRKQVCTCSKAALLRYRQKLSGPLLDRFDLFLHVPRVEWQELQQLGEEESSQAIAYRVREARLAQQERQASTQVASNKDLPSSYLNKLALSSESQSLLKQATEGFQLSTRGYYRVLRVARTIADLEGAVQVEAGHIAEALQYRKK